MLAACADTSAPGDSSGTPVLTMVRGDAQISPAGSELAAPIVVRATNARGAPLRGMAIGWNAMNDGLAAPDRLVTDDSGLVRTTWTLGAVYGRQTATATVGAQTVTFRATAVEPLSLGSIRRLKLATFEGSGEVVHPDVVRVPRGWASARRFLAITPYPGGDIHRELPSVYQSGDPSEWVAPDGLTNPVIRPRKGYVSDPDLVFEPDRGELWMYFRHVRRNNDVFVVATSDGTRWTRPKRVVSVPNHQLVSPAVVRVGPNDWHMWSVSAGAIGCRNETTFVEHRTSRDGLHWSPPAPVQMSGPDELTPWHVDVVWVPEMREFWALYNEKPTDSCATPALRLVTSADGITWKRYPTPVLRAGVIAELKHIVYRSTLEYDARTDMVTLWYSGARAGYGDNAWVWSAAVERRTRAELFRLVETPEVAQRMAVPRTLPKLLEAP